MQNKKNENKKSIFLTSETNLLNKIKKDMKSFHTKTKIDFKIKKIKPLDLTDDLSKKIDEAINDQREINKNILNGKIEIRKPFDKNPKKPEFKTDSIFEDKIVFDEELFETEVPTKIDFTQKFFELSDERSFSFFFRNKDKKNDSAKKNKVKPTKKEKKQTKPKISKNKKNGVKKTKKELEKTKDELIKKKKEIEEIEKKAKEKQKELKNKEILTKKKEKKLLHEKKEKERLKKKQQHEKEKIEKRHKTEEEKLKKKREKELEKKKKIEEKQKIKTIKIQEKKKEKPEKKEQKQEKEKKVKIKKKIRIGIKRKDGEKKKLFKDKEEENITEPEKTQDIKGSEPVLFDDEISQALEIIDELLGELPEEKIDEFVQSDDFKIYERVVSRYKKK